MPRPYDCLHCGDQLDSPLRVRLHLAGEHSDCVACHAHWLALYAAHTPDSRPSLIRISRLGSQAHLPLDEEEAWRIDVYEVQLDPPGAP